MKPFLRPTDRPPLAPVGWTAEPAGTWNGRTCDVVYDARRHDIALVSAADDPTRCALGEAGFRCSVTDHGRELWVRDRAERSASTVALAVSGGLEPEARELGR